MSKANNQTAQLRELIYQALQKVTAKNAPNVHEAIQTQQGYKNIEARIITMSINEGIMPESCIPHIEESL